MGVRTKCPFLIPSLSPQPSRSPYSLTNIMVASGAELRCLELPSGLRDQSKRCIHPPPVPFSVLFSFIISLSSYLQSILVN